jgi:hypothetical protein
MWAQWTAAGTRQKQGGDRKSKSVRKDFDRPAQLKDLEISKNEASTCQQFAEIALPDRRRTL